MKIKKLLNLFVASLLMVTGLNAMTTEEKLKQLYIFVVNNNSNESIGLSLVDAAGGDLYDVANKAEDEDESVIIMIDPEEDRNIQFPLKLILYPSGLGIAKKLDVEFKDEIHGESGAKFKGKQSININDDEHRLVFTIKEIYKKRDKLFQTTALWTGVMTIEKDNLEAQTKNEISLEFPNYQITYRPTNEYMLEKFEHEYELE